jgi:hypothetical protein
MPMDRLIAWLLDEDRQLKGMPLGEVTFDTTGQKVLVFDRTNEIDQRVAKGISTATQKNR